MTTRSGRQDRPVDGGIVWHEQWNAFECLGCGEFEEIRKRADRVPEKLAEVKELLVADHTECWEYSDARLAKLARRFRKSLKRQSLTAGTPSRRGSLGCR